MDDNCLWTSPPKQKHNILLERLKANLYLFTETIHPSLLLSFRWKQRPPQKFPRKKFLDWNVGPNC